MKFITTEIRGATYKLAKLDPIKAGRIATKVGVLLAAAAEDATGISALIEAYKNRAAPADGSDAAGLDALMSTPKLLSALAGGVAKINADELYSLALDCVRGNLFADKKLHDDDALNAHFEDHPDRMFLVLAWALKENAAGFFGFGGKD